MSWSSEDKPSTAATPRAKRASTPPRSSTSTTSSRTTAHSSSTAGTSASSSSSSSSTMSWFNYLRVPVALTSALAAGLSGLLYWKQNELIYPRSVPPGSRTEVPSPADFPEYGNMHNSEELYIRTADGETIHGYLLRPGNKVLHGGPPSSDITVLMFHGNAGNIGHRLPIAGVLDISVRCNIVLLEYRGYGRSTGVPDEKGINLDAQAGLDWIRSRDDLRNTKLIVYGQSLGGAVAIQLVVRNQESGAIKAVILENSFLSIRKMIPHAVPPAKFLAPLCHQIWPSEETIRAMRVPVLFLSGLEDEIVPSSHMQQLYEVCGSKSKRLKLFPQGNHNNTVAAPGYFEAVTEFIEYHFVRKGRIFPDDESS